MISELLTVSFSLSVIKADCFVVILKSIVMRTACSRGNKNSLMWLVDGNMTVFHEGTGVVWPRALDSPDHVGPSPCGQTYGVWENIWSGCAYVRLYHCFHVITSQAAIVRSFVVTVSTSFLGISRVDILLVIKRHTKAVWIDNASYTLV